MAVSHGPREWKGIDPEIARKAEGALRDHSKTGEQNDSFTELLAPEEEESVRDAIQVVKNEVEKVSEALARLLTRLLMRECRC